MGSSSAGAVRVSIALGTVAGSTAQISTVTAVVLTNANILHVEARLIVSSNDGHAGYSTLAAFENFTTRVADSIIAKPNLFRHTAILGHFDQGGAYYDSGYVQPLDYFGDGTRVPMLVLSPYTAAGHISHTYDDHVSVVKFIEANWGLPPLTATSLDNLPDPVPSASDPYVPVNRPAIGDLMSLFDFHHPQADPPCIPLYGPQGPNAYPDAGHLPAIPARCVRS